MSQTYRSVNTVVTGKVMMIMRKNYVKTEERGVSVWSFKLGTIYTLVENKYPKQHFTKVCLHTEVCLLSTYFWFTSVWTECTIFEQLNTVSVYLKCFVEFEVEFKRNIETLNATPISFLGL